jgi:hypothetical protein
MRIRDKSWCEAVQLPGCCAGGQGIDTSSGLQVHTGKSQCAARGRSFLTFKVVLADQGSLNYWAFLGSYFASVPKEGLPEGISFLLSIVFSEVPRASQKGALLDIYLHHFPCGNCTVASTLHLPSRPFASIPTRRTHPSSTRICSR